MRALGDEVDGYRLVKTLGRGGMGVVYLAEDLLLERHVALKLIAATSPGPELRQYFRDEARALARLQHPNIVLIHRAGELDGQLYIVTELVRGTTLTELTKPVPRVTLLAIARGIVRGLAAAHREGVLHRDLKPANIMLTEAGAPKLLDFGLAKIVGGTKGVAGAPAPVFAGTPIYMAPELLLGEEATPRSEIFAVGCVLYELATGTSARASIKAALRLAPHRPLDEFAHDLDPRFVSTIERCLCEDPAARFGSATELLEALEDAQVDVRTPVAPDTNPYRGLQPFGAEHRALFFGRNGDIEGLLDRLRGDRLAIVAGDSGVGKSSLVRAGVIPRILEGALGDGREYRAGALLPGRSPLAALAQTLAAISDLGEEAARVLMDSEPVVVARELGRSLGSRRGAVVFIDQAEELFTLASPGEAERFALVLGRIVALASGVRVLVTVRGDFFTRFSDLPDLGADLGRAMFVLRALPQSLMELAIVGPARHLGASFESPEMVGRLANAAAAAPGGLPLLQFALAELWEARERNGNRITEAALQSLGGVAGALGRHGDAVLAGLRPNEQAAARRVLLRLVTLDATRLRRSAHELDANEPATRAALEALVRGRLVVTREVADGVEYEVAHEALLEGWETLRAWLQADGTTRPARERIARASSEWDRLGRPSEALFGAKLLREAAAVEVTELTAVERDFVKASRAGVLRAGVFRAALVLALPATVGATLVWNQVQAERALEARIAHEVVEGRALVDGGRAAATRARTLRTDALRVFEAADTAPDADAPAQMEAAERAWSAAAAAAREAEHALAAAARPFERALALAPGREPLRSAVADLIYERALLAGDTGNAERRSDLLQLLSAYDDGSRPAALAAPPRLTVTTEPAGARLSLARYEEEDRRYRLGSAAVLGAAPLGERTIAQGPGSYLLTAELPGRPPVRLPLRLGPGERRDLSLRIPSADEVPDGYVYIPGGPALYGSADPDPVRHAMSAVPMLEVNLGPFLVAREEVTFADWLQFLRASSPAERARRRPRTNSTVQWGLELNEAPSGAYRLVLIRNGRRVSAAEGELMRFEGRDRRAAQDWLRFPVTGISLDDVEAYAGWLDRTGRVPRARLCTEREWERMARGGDARAFPHGDVLEGDEANIDETYGRKPDAFGPDEVGRHPESASPFGVLDAAGNAVEWTRPPDGRSDVWIRGGGWYFDEWSARIPNRAVAQRDMREALVGARLCADAK